MIETGLLIYLVGGVSYCAGQITRLWYAHRAQQRAIEQIHNEQYACPYHRTEVSHGPDLR